MELLYDKSGLEAELDALPDWQQAAYHAFESMLADTNTYPCVPARLGFLENQLRFSFIEDPSPLEAADDLAHALKAYGDVSRECGSYTSLVAFIHTPDAFQQQHDIEDYRSLFWSILSQTSALDESDWPAHIPLDPEHHEWEFSFAGEPYFAFCATPAHIDRQSRHFPCLLIAFQPRWVFDELNGSTEFGRKMKNIIRKRLVDYDGMPGHPDLKWYGQADNYEWKQYFISDDDSSPSRCPFHPQQQPPIKK
ncbi:YqcI/YcgG family protein [Lentibacillus saliphilus]|uniref:YqcI/YcgG family protein n=1 Tax=Lentibacillus saliphilus TaxID=2737028 RepID=UPI001C3112F0|nr:YqcI/YcgG family protein [Lentibacillus saliphilus]